MIESWRAPFIGNAHEAYMDILRDMYGKSARSFEGDWYVVHASIMQSSGSGKSRLIDEIAKHIFTIPINLRSLADATRKLRVGPFHVCMRTHRTSCILQVMLPQATLPLTVLYMTCLQVGQA